MDLDRVINAHGYNGFGNMFRKKEMGFCASSLERFPLTKCPPVELSDLVSDSAKRQAPSSIFHSLFSSDSGLASACHMSSPVCQCQSTIIILLDR